MRLIDENYKPIDDISFLDGLKYFWVYNFKKTDFFLKSEALWKEVITDSYRISIDGSVVSIPSDYYIMIGDMEGGLDFITPEEIVGREFEALTFSIDLCEKSWELDDLRVIGYEEECRFVIPFLKQPFPIAINDKRAIMISLKDQYRTIKEYGFEDII